MISELRQICCDLCGGDAIPVQRSPWPGPWQLFRCGACGLVSVRADGKVVDYWAEDLCGLDVYGDATYLAEVDRRYRKYLGILGGLNGAPGVLLDAGCGPGNFLRAAQRSGWAAYGVEMSEKAAARARDLGLVVETARLEDTRWPDHRFDVITLWDLIEHLDSPRRAIEVVHRKLRPGGLLLLETPDEDFVMRRIVLAARRLSGGRADLSRYFYYPDHRFYFSERTLTALLIRAGFQIVRVSRDVTTISKARLKISPSTFPLKRIVLGVMPVSFGILSRLGLGNKLIVLARKPDEHRGAEAANDAGLQDAITTVA